MSKLTDEQIDRLLPEIVNGGFTVITYGRAVARAIEAAATAPLLQRIAELEAANEVFVKRQNQWNLRMIETERQLHEQAVSLEEARKQMDAQKDEWLAWEAKRKALEKDADLYRQLRNGSNWPAVFASHDAPEPLRGEELDAAMQKGQS